MDDLISRQAAIELIERMKPYQLDAEDCQEIIHNMPSAEVEPVKCEDCKTIIALKAVLEPVKRGKWIKNDGKRGWHCSVCQEDDVYAFSWNSDTGRYDFQDRYCPNCGAKMKGVDRD